MVDRNHNWQNIVLRKLLLLGGIFSGGLALHAAVLPEVLPKGSYVVVASQETVALAEWKAVVTALREKYDGSLILYPSGNVDAIISALKAIHPRFTAFVARPEEAGRAFVVSIHRLTRKLDADPYTDTRWGIVTGYEAADALRIVTRKEPLIINSAASSMGPCCFKNLDHGFASAETAPEKFFIKKVGEETKELAVTPDPVKHLVDAFNTQSPDMFVTSGHATEHDWQVIYNQHRGSFRHKDGQLFGLNSQKKRFDIDSPGAKIYLPLGNCLIGHIPERDCMATAWMHTGGVHQMFGYTAVTFHGYMGWGTGSYFNNQYSLSEAFFFNNQSLVWALQKDFPEKADVNFDKFDHFAIRRMAQKHKINDRNLLGHLWDRDSVAFYGDPAWIARHRLDDPAWTVESGHAGENVQITITVLKDGKWWNRPLAIPFPKRLARVRGVSWTREGEPLVTDDFALLPLKGERKAGEQVVLEFGAYSVDAPVTSASATPIVVGQADTDISMPAEPDAEAQKPFRLDTLGLPAEEARQIAYALRQAGDNADELIKALQTGGNELMSDIAFLIANMPSRDLRSLQADYLIEHARYAQRALAEAPWKAAISPELYQEYVLPYANLTEKREAWRPVLYEKLKPLVSGCKRSGEAAILLNQKLFALLGVQYHATKRPRADQAPLESIKAGYASCTGLSILLVDACRAMGVPARVAGVAEWTKGPGNHTWVEVWDHGWHCIGAAESKELNRVWFGKGAAAADASNPMKRIYVARFRRVPLRFPVAWDPYADYIPAADVTMWYKEMFGDR